MEFRIAHIALTVSDMDKALDFYVEKLGLKHAFTLYKPDGTPNLHYIKIADGQFLELFYASDELVTKNTSFRHLCLQVEDCAAAAKELEAAGIEIITPPKQGKDTNWQCWIADPDGNRIEIMQISPESPQAKA